MSIRQEDDHAHFQNSAGEFYEFLSSIRLSAIISKTSNACSNPLEYDWRYAGKQERLVPYNRSAIATDPERRDVSNIADKVAFRWEKHCVWVVEGTVHRGESNMLPRRCFYLDEDTWLILLGEAFDVSGNLKQCFMLNHFPNRSSGGNGRWYQISGA